MERIKILVVEDKVENRNEAKKQFITKNVDLTCVDCFSLAAALLRKYPYDMVLTDLMLAGEDKGIVKNNPQVGQELPYGLVVAIMAKNYAVPHVAILTDISHQSAPIPWAMDELLGDNECVSAYNHKDWLKVAEKFVTINEQSGSTESEKGKKLYLIAGSYDEHKYGIAEDLKSDTAECLVLSKSKDSEILATFVEEKPDYVILIGEMYREVPEHYIEEELKKILSLKSENQKVLVLGFMDSKSDNYLHLPVAHGDIVNFFE